MTGQRFRGRHSCHERRAGRAVRGCCTGFRGLSVAIVDSLPEVGGQIMANSRRMGIRDVAGFPWVLGRGGH
jgi:hypothetical protein